MSLHNRLKEYRAKLDINQQEMGRLVGASRQTISLIERERLFPVRHSGFKNSQRVQCGCGGYFLVCGGRG